MVQLKDVLHYYLGCEVIFKDEAWKLKSVEIGINGNICGKITRKRHDRQTYDLENYEFRKGESTIMPILWPLSDMTEEEAEEFVLSCLNSPHAPEYFDTIEKDELQIEFVKNDGGLMLDDDVDLYFEVSCRCLDGYIAIMKDGRIGMAKESDVPTREMQPVDDVYGKVHWLLSKHFDLFGLIESGQAISKAAILTDDDKQK
jgi:hypothetical protein